MGINNFNNKVLNSEIPEIEHHLDKNNYLTVSYSDTVCEEFGKIKNIGEKFAVINSFFLDYLKEYHIPVGYVKSHHKNNLLYINHEKFPFYVKITNMADKRTAKIFSIKEGTDLNLPVIEIHFGEGKDSMITESHLQAFNLCTIDEIRLIYRICSKVNVVLKSFFDRRNHSLVEVSCLFGKSEGKIYVVDGFTPSSLKILPAENNSRQMKSFKLSTSNEMRHYTDKILNFINT